MDNDARRALSRHYFDDTSLADHHFRSFNALLEHGLQTIVYQIGSFGTSLDDEDDEEPIRIDLGSINIGSPHRLDSDGSEKKIFPQEARLRNLTYAAPISLDLQIVIGGRNRDEHVLSDETVQIGQLPIMVRSKHCNLHGLSEDEIIAKGEDPADPGGYFIVNGSERALITSEDLVSNRILTEFDQRYGDQIEVAKTYSRQHGYRAITTVERDRDRLLKVSFPGVTSRISFPKVVRALGIESDKDIVKEFSKDINITKSVIEALEVANIQTQQAAVESIGSELAPDRETSYQVDRAYDVLDRHLLPHLNRPDEPRQSRLSKASYLCRMAESCLELALGRRPPDDKDHYSNKRLRTSGDLIKGLFRSALNRLGRDIEYQLKRSINRSRRVSVTNVVQSEVITKRLEQAIATGSWVGGRSGVSQLVDRTDHMGILSQLRRLKSPLSRSQPHFDARDLHGSQWGRVCPSETPEGPNCGLEKNFAQTLELSTAVPDEERFLENLESFGVNMSAR